MGNSFVQTVKRQVCKSFCILFSRSNHLTFIGWLFFCFRNTPHQVFDAVAVIDFQVISFLGIDEMILLAVSVFNKIRRLIFMKFFQFCVVCPVEQLD